MITSLISLKLVADLTREMVNLDLTKRALTFVGRQVYQMSSALIEQVPQQHRALLKPSFYPSTTSSSDPSSSASTEYLVHNWFDALFTWFQMVVLWHDPFVSVCTISGLFSLFLLLTYFAPRFYATIMIVIFIYNLTKVWFRHVWPEIRVPPEEDREEELRLDVDRWTHLHPHLMTLTELNQLTKNLINSSENYLQNLLVLRREKPVAFCSIICSTLFCTAYIGNRVSGSTLIMFAISVLVLAPGIYLHVLPKVATKYLKQRFTLIVFQNAQTQQANTVTEPVSLRLAPMLALLKLLKTDSYLAGQLRESIKTLKPGTSLPEAIPDDGDATLTDYHQQFQSNRTDEEKEDGGRGEDERENQTSSPIAPRKSSDDLSSNESTSLVDLDEDQQDGFVML